jgi:hypothetical protein
VGLVLILITVRTLNTRGDRAMGEHFADGKRRWGECYLRRHDIQGCDRETGFPIYPNAAATRLQEKLDFLEARHLNLFRTQ